MSENAFINSDQNANKSTDDAYRHFGYRNREIRRAERRATRHENGPWIAGIVLILLGVIFILQNVGVAMINNWWALFLLFPALGSFSTAYTLYQRNENKLTYAVRGSLIGGCAFSILTAVFLFNISFGILWPLILIAGGVVLLINFVLPE